MRDYELVTIFKSALAEEEVEKKLGRYHEVVTGGGGEITAVEHWGKQQLSYPIANETNGYYVVSQFTADAGHLEEMERLIKLDEDLLRHLVVLSEGEPATAPSLRRRDADDDDDDDEDDDEDERPRGKREKGEEESEESEDSGEAAEDEESGADEAEEEADSADEAEEEAETADEADEEED